MKTKLLPLVAMAWTCATSMQAQQVTVSPLPQEITWGSKAFDKGFSYTLTGESDADADAVRVLKSGLTAGSGSNVNIVIGERGDAAVAAYEGNIPNKKEGYYLKVEPGKVIIAGNDESGTFYGVQTFLQIASQPEVMSATVTDYPDVIDRGVIEGFYGNWWSQEDRIRQFEFYGKNKMNVYIYAPKDDPYHRGKWRDPYPASEAAKLKELVAKAKENKVQFVWSIHPGNDIQWNETDMQKVLNKFELMYDIGVRAFGLLFDDINGTEQSRADKQAEFINYVTDNFIKKYPELPPIIFCPTQYNRGWSSGTYLDVLGENAYKEARIMWTGNSVVDMISKSDMDWINAKLQRNAYIWLNYPTNDYCIDRMLMGPTYGNDKNIAEQLSGFTANPSEYAEASKVSLYSIADYTWNMTDYDENASWERAIKYLMPDHAEAFKVFCENNIDLGSTTHGLRRKDESKRFAEAIEVFEKATVNGLNQEAFDNIKPMFDEFVNSCEELLDPQVQENDPLAKELVAWFQVMKLMGERGQKMCSLYATLENNQPEEFLKLYKEMVALEAEQKSIRSRDFEGSINRPNPTVAAEVVAPFMKQYTNLLIAEYKELYSEGWENFPAVLLNDGKYYIKYDGKYLTNESGSSYPTFVSTVDDINPQRQEWVISMDYNTNRYKIVNAQDQRYLNEKGEFTVNETTNPYESAWHSYNITRMNGKYAIQNAGSAGDKYWTTSSTRISTGSSNAYSPDNFKFEFVPLDEEAVTYPVIVDGGNYFIIDPTDGTYLTNNGSNNPKFEAKKDKDPQNTQAWTFSVIPAVNRYKIVSVADGRNLNELGQFGTAYDDNWNTYKLQELGGQFLIQNAGRAGSNFWSIENNAISKGSKTESESYIFKLEMAAEAPMDEEAKQVFHKEGLVTDASQIADGDYVVLQNVNTGNPNSQGYFYYQDDTKFLTYLNGYYRTEMTDMKESFPDKYVFQVEKKGVRFAFKNVTAQKYIPNDVTSGGYAPTADASKSQFTISASGKVSLAWDIKSTANGKYINGEPGCPVAWSDGHPIKIYKVAKSADLAENMPHTWFRIQTTDGRNTLRLHLGDNQGNDLVWMKSLIGAAEDGALWSLQESPEVAGRYTLVNKKHENGSVDWENDLTHETPITKFGYTLDRKDYGIYVKTQDTEVLPSWIMYRMSEGSSTLRFLNQQGTYLKETTDTEENGKLWKMIPAVSMQMTEEGYAVGAFSAPIATSIPNGVWVYSAATSTKQTVNLTHLEGKVLPANTPVILVAKDAGNYEMLPANDNEEAVTVKTNLLKSSTSGRILAPAQCFALKLDGQKAYLAPAEKGNIIAGYSVYMLTGGNSPKTLVFDELPPTTGIQDPENGVNVNNGKIYDLGGREVTNPTKGVYIRNGKKFIVNQ